MRSSGSTPNRRSRRRIARYVLVVGDDHPKACTGRRLLRQGLALPAPPRKLERGPILLDPFAPDPLSGADLGTAEREGIAAVDCSWNRLSERGHLRDRGPRGAGTGLPRRLPLLVATNPQHFGRIGQLNTVEALGAALYLLDRPSEAKELLQGFAGGEALLEVNRLRLDRYRGLRSPEEVRATERALFGPVPDAGDPLPRRRDRPS